MTSLNLVVILFLGSVLLTDAHIRLQEPPQRASLYRDERFVQYNLPAHPDDTAIYCGPVLQNPEVDNCGVCGDRLTDPTPRAHEHGGMYGRGIIAANYSRGATFDFDAFLRINHAGWFWAELCDERPENEECFSKYPPLEISYDGSTNTIHPVPTGANVWMNGTMTLPRLASCQNCVLRLTYRGGDQCPGRCACSDTVPGTTTCLMQQHYRNCVDVSITI